MIFNNRLLSSFSLSAIYSFIKYLHYRQTKTSSGNGENIQPRLRSPRRDPYFGNHCSRVSASGLWLQWRVSYEWPLRNKAKFALKYFNIWPGMNCETWSPNDIIFWEIFFEKLLPSNSLCHRMCIESEVHALVCLTSMLCCRHKLNYEESIPVEQLVIHLCDIKQAYTQFGGKRLASASIQYCVRHSGPVKLRRN